MNNLPSGAKAPGSFVFSSLSPGRHVRTLMTVATVAMLLLGGLAVTPSVARADAEAGFQSQTTDNLKLRAAPALNAEILTVIPVGGSVTVAGGAENGFYAVTWQGQSGYAYGAYLTGVEATEGPVTTGGEQGEVYVADGPVNFRSGPSTDDPVISVIPDGALVALNGDSANGFVGIIYTDRSGWAHAASIFGTGEGDEEPVDQEGPDSELPPAEEPAAGVPVGEAATGVATVVDGRLNLRTGPGTTYDVVTVMPDGASVELRGELQNGFQPLAFDGVTGWASSEWLQVGDAPTEPEPTEPPVTEEPTTEPEPTEPPVTEEPTTPPVDGSDGYTEDEIIQIIYAAADEYGQSREDMLRVARCESVLDPSAVNASSNASGLFQFLPSTWETTPYADQDIFDPEANAEAAAWMWANGRRNEWVCQ